jgi:hypothetical protein
VRLGQSVRGTARAAAASSRRQAAAQQRSRRRRRQEIEEDTDEGDETDEEAQQHQRAATAAGQQQQSRRPERKRQNRGRSGGGRAISNYSWLLGTEQTCAWYAPQVRLCCLSLSLSHTIGRPPPPVLQQIAFVPCLSTRPCAGSPACLRARLSVPCPPTAAAVQRPASAGRGRSCVLAGRP